LLVQAAEHADAVVERLAGDETGGAELHAVAPNERLNARAVCRREDRLAQRGVERGVQLCDSSHACTSGTRCSTSVRWPWESSMRASQPGTCAASHSPCALGTIRSSPPWMTSTGRLIASSANPHGSTNARLSSIQPSAPSASAWLMLLWR